MANNLIGERVVVTFLARNRFKMNFFAWFLLLGNKEWGSLISSIKFYFCGKLKRKK
jgi:hypothetical protein